MPKQTAPDVDEIMKALAHPVRREILAWLKTPEVAFRERHHPFEMGIWAGMIFEKARRAARRRGGAARRWPPRK